MFGQRGSKLFLASKILVGKKESAVTLAQSLWSLPVENIMFLCKLERLGSADYNLGDSLKMKKC